MNIQKLPMRNGVGVIILNNENKVFVGKRKDNPVNKWQMPQGGVEIGESYLSAMKRELYEETSIKSIKILREIDGFFEYELPKYLVGIIWIGKFRGQKQKWFITRFIGNENEIDLNLFTIINGLKNNSKNSHYLSLTGKENIILDSNRL